MTDSGPASDASWALRDLLLAAATANRSIARRLGVSTGDLTALDHLLAGAPVGTGELAERLGVRSPSATATVDRLEAAGLVERLDHPTDRRRVVVEVSPRARSRIDEAVRPLVEELDGLVDTLSATERRVVVEHLRGVADVLRRHGSP